jgi:hypothetical protein
MASRGVHESELAERLCAGCRMQPGQAEKSGHAGIPSFRAIANRPGQSVDGIANWLKIAPPRCRTTVCRKRRRLGSRPSSCR